MITQYNVWDNMVFPISMFEPTKGWSLLFDSNVEGYIVKGTLFLDHLHFDVG